MRADIEKDVANHSVTKQERDRLIVQMAKQKVDVNEIADKVQVSLTTVYRVLQLYNLDVKELTSETKLAKRAKKQADRAEQKAQKQEQYIHQMVEMYQEQGMSTRGIAATLQLSEEFVCDALREQGIDLQSVGKRKLIERDKTILEALEMRKSAKELAAQYGLTYQTIKKIEKGGWEDIARREERLKELEEKKETNKANKQKEEQKQEDTETEKEKLLSKMRSDAAFYAELKLKLEQNAKKGNWKPFIQFTETYIRMREEPKARELIRMAKQIGNMPIEVKNNIRIWENTMQKRMFRKQIVPEIQKGNIQKIEAIVDQYLQNKKFRTAKQVVEVCLECTTRQNPMRNKLIELQNTIQTEKKQYLLEEEQAKQRKQQEKEAVKRILLEKTDQVLSKEGEER